MKIYFFLILFSCQAHASFCPKSIQPAAQAKTSKKAKSQKDNKKSNEKIDMPQSATSYEDEGWITMGVDYCPKGFSVYFQKRSQKKHVMIRESHVHELRFNLGIPSIQFHGFGRRDQSSDVQGILFSFDKKVLKDLSYTFYGEYQKPAQLSDPKKEDFTILFPMPDEDIAYLKTIVHSLNK